jgi:hypothetical protein
MSELSECVKVIETATNAELSPIFQFPYSVDYKEWMLDRLKTFPSQGKGRWRELYLDIIETQIEPSEVYIPSEWKTRITSFSTSFIYILADDNEQILYVGMSKSGVVSGLLDRLLPASSEKHPNGQKMNHTSEIWDEYLLKGKRLHCFFCYDLELDPEKTKYIILDDYKNRYRRLPKYNKQMPTEPEQ